MKSTSAAAALALSLWLCSASSAFAAQAQDFHASRKLLDAAPQCARAGQFVADTSTGCKSYWQCTGPGQGVYQSCGAGTAFDSSCSCCNFPSAFTCSAAPSSPAAAATSQSPPASSVPASTPPATSAGSAGPPPSAASCTAASQFVPDTSVGCAKFWQCTGPQQGVYQSCNSGLIFDTSCNCCNFPSSTNCKGSSAPAAPTPVSPASSPSPPSAPASPAPGTTGTAASTGISGTGICSEYGTYSTDTLRSGVACQNELGKYSDANTMVTAANFANTPFYNAQCGQCLRVTNLEGAGQVYVTVIDKKGDPGTPAPPKLPVKTGTVMTTIAVACNRILSLMQQSSTAPA